MHLIKARFSLMIYKRFIIYFLTFSILVERRNQLYFMDIQWIRVYRIGI